MELDIPRLRGVTHAYAFWLALVAAGALIALTPAGAPRVAAAIYGAGLCAVFGGSGLYHRWRWHPRWRPLLRRARPQHDLRVHRRLLHAGRDARAVGRDPLDRADHGLGGRAARDRLQRGVGQRAALAVLGDATSLLGWVAVLAVPQLVSTLPVAPLVLVAAGRRALHVGAVVFALGRPDPWPRVFGFHEIFHVFVILAAVAHFVAMAGWIVPSGLDG